MACHRETNGSTDMNDRIRVLYVDDDAGDYVMLREMFSAISPTRYQLEWAVDYDKALEMIRLAEHHVYIVDYFLGTDNRTGLDLIAEAFPGGCRVPVILLTGRGKEEVDERALKLGVAEYFDKPDLRVPLLERAIRYAIERKRTESQLRASEARVRSIIQFSPDAIYVLSKNRVITQTNPAALALLGYAEQELMGHPFDEVIQKSAQQSFFALMESLSLEVVRRQELELLHKDGRVVVADCQMALMPGEQEQPAAYILTVRDVTERKKAELALQESLKRERELNELKTRFVSTVSHEFRTPLTIIRTAAFVLKNYFDRMDSDKIATKFSAIEAQIEHMALLIEDVLSLSKIQAGRVDFKPEVRDLAFFCQVTVDEFSETHNLSDRLTARIPADAVNYPFDPKWVRQIIWNLLDNARKYSPDGKPIVIELLQEPAQVVLQITDEGIGIPEDDLSHLFEPFHRASNVSTVPGSGLGMAIVDQAVDLHHGRIEISSRINKGSTFRIILPLPSSLTEATTPKE